MFAPISRVHISLGSNIGDRAAMLARAVEAMRAFASLDSFSKIYESQPAYVTHQASFYNAVVGGMTTAGPFELLEHLKRIETLLGRVPSYENGPRAIDLDILFHGASVIDSLKLVLPHPRLAERSFVLVPLVEIAPELVHPKTGKTMRQILDEGGAIHGGATEPVAGSSLLA